MSSPTDRPQDRPSSADQGIIADPPPERLDMPVIRVPSQQDLTVPPAAPQPVASNPPATQLARLTTPADRPAVKPAVGVFSDIKRSGRWRVDPTTKFVHVFGDAIVDLREAEFTSPTVEIEAFGLFGDLKVFVTPGTAVEVHGWTIFGDQSVKDVPDTPPNGRRVVINTKGGFGDVIVYTLEPGEQPARWWQKGR